MARDYDHLFKLLIIGDSGVGKTSIMTRFADDLFTGTYISTIGVDFKIRTFVLDGETIRLQIWDTAGQERFKTITTTFYRGTHGVIVVYDVTRMESFVGVKRWLLEIENNCDANVNRVLVGNKCDRDEIVVPTADGQKLASDLSIPFIETSAKENINIEELFSIVTRLAIHTRKSVGGLYDMRGTSAPGGGSTVRVRPRSQHNPPPKNKCC